MDNFIFKMYASDPYYDEEVDQKNLEQNDKKLSKIIGGMKAQGVDCKIINIDGVDIELPRMDYVRVLEKQVKELRNKISVMEQKSQRMSDQYNTLSIKLKNLEDENKRAPFRFRKN